MSGQEAGIKSLLERESDLSEWQDAWKDSAVSVKKKLEWQIRELQVTEPPGVVIPEVIVIPKVESTAGGHAPNLKVAHSVAVELFR